MESIVGYLRRFVAFSDEELEAMWQRVNTLTLKKTELFVREGQVAREVAFTVEGYLRVYFNHHGQEITRDITPLHTFATALPSLIAQQPSYEIIEAATDCKLLVININDLEWLYSTYPQWERFGRRVIEDMFVKAQQRLYEFITLTAEQRYAKLMEEYPDMLLNVPLQYLASYIGVTAQSFSRLRRGYMRA